MSEQRTWEISGHNGIEVDGDAGVAVVDRDFAKRMRVVSCETDDSYIEISVQKEYARQLRDILNVLEADNARYRAALEDIARVQIEDDPYPLYAVAGAHAACVAIARSALTDSREGEG